ncbi:Ger(x)C family spore germination protein [Sporosarcina cascadiensis]|uniref:Ger(x)C family spore germination protein n=1 Tax=Sporosarcina cascadiensis TaxID=2660747 RepID=UPI00129A6833|nr:Ger(x)C family spore germination protein [Sporosarcina cascadiensis]
MNRVAFFLLIGSAVLLSGCWDMNEPERMLYVNGMGVDFKDGKYEVYTQVIDFANTAKNDQPTTDHPQAEVGYASGDTLDDAINQLYHSMDQKLFWGHFSYLVVSEEVMKNVKVSPIIDSFIRYRETRYQIWIYTTQDSVEDILLIRPVINRAITLSKLGDPENSYEQESFIPPVNLRKLIIGLDEPGYEATIPLITIEENWKSMKESIQAPELSGVGVITRDGFKGYISGEKALGIQWMTNETKRGEVTFKTGEGNEMTVIIENVKVKIEPNVTHEVNFNAEIELQANISSIKGNITVKQIKKEVEEEVSRQIMATYHDAIDKDIDIYRFSEQLYRKELETWKKIQENGRVNLTEDSFGKLQVRVIKLNSDRKSFKETIKK